MATEVIRSEVGAVFRNNFAILGMALQAPLPQQAVTTAAQGIASLRALAGRAILRGATGYPRREGDASVSLMARN